MSALRKNNLLTLTRLTMQADRNKKKFGKPSGSSFSKEQKEQLKKVAAGFGMNVPRPGQQLDSQFTEGRSKESEKKRKDEENQLYYGVVNLIGQSTLNNIENATYFMLATLLTGFLGTGLAISSEAFYKASQKQVPQMLDTVVLNTEQWFTPLLVVFLVLSSLLGLYKQAQLTAGAAQYDETKRN